MMRMLRACLLVAVALLVAGVERAAAQDRLCDPAAEDCRSILLNYIRNEHVAIDVAFWFMEDARYTAELVRRHQAGVRVRVLVDTRANASYPLNAQRLQELQNGGIPMRRKTSSYILHWKMMLFHGQNVVEFSGANYSADAWSPRGTVPYTNYIDEAIYFTSDTAIVDSFRTQFDNQWVDMENWANYANVAGPLTRSYGILPKDPSLNFPPAENFRTRSLALYRNENYWIDAIMYRITDRRHTDEILAAVARGVSVRLITEPEQYRDPSRLWHSWNVDRLYMGGVQIRHRAHPGLNHQKSVILYGQNVAIFGSSNWTSPSAAGQLEHNMFTKKPHMTWWFADQFHRKWYNRTGSVETAPFVPLPPDTPAAPFPANGATNVSPEAPLQWYGGPWAHLYDIYLGTDPSASTLVASNVELGPSERASEKQRFVPPVSLRLGTTYYWRIVGKTMALQTRSSPVWSFTVSSTAPPPGVPTLVSPSNVASPKNPTFTWNAVPGATYYYLWINDSTGNRFARWFTNVQAGCPLNTGRCAITTTVPLRAGRIVWWVQAWSPQGGYGQWSRAVSYTQEPLSRPALVSPSGAVADWPRIQFRWETVPGATHHYLWVTDAAGVIRVRTWYTLAETRCGSTCSITLTPTFGAESATWWIQAWNATSGYSAWSPGMRISQP